MCSSSSSSSSSSSLPQRLNGWIYAPPLVPQHESDGFEVRAASVPESTDGGSEKSKFKETLVPGSLFGVWYLFNVYFNIYNKQVLKVYPYPITVTAAQFAVGTVLVIFIWTSNLYKRPKISRAPLAAMLPLAVVHTLCNLFTNMSLGKVAVSFTHTIKAMEPFFSVVLSAMFLGEKPTIWVVSSLLPIVGGVGLASMTEASFNWCGVGTYARVYFNEDVHIHSHIQLILNLILNGETRFYFIWIIMIRSSYPNADYDLIFFAGKIGRDFGVQWLLTLPINLEMSLAKNSWLRKRNRWTTLRSSR